MPNWPAFRQLVFLNLFSLFEILPFLLLKGGSTWNMPCFAQLSQPWFHQTPNQTMYHLRDNHLKITKMYMSVRLAKYWAPFLPSPSFQLLLWCPVRGCALHVSWLSSHHMSNPSPFPSHDDGAHAVVVAASEMLAGDGLGQKFAEFSSGS